jgi:4-hydroxy-4-methyl-2-oxoglutarate aldolase
MKPRIVRNIERPDPELVRKLGEFGTATVHEAQGRVGLMLPYMRPIYPEARIASPAVTVLCHPGDNLMFHAAIEVCKPGDALVVATHSDSTDGFFGELLATSCRAHGIQGLVIHAGVRDVADLTAMNIDIVCAGALVHPGDVIVGDVDGIVVVPRQDAAEVVRLSEARLAKEAKNRERLKAGELGLDMYGLREKLKNLGVEWV